MKCLVVYSSKTGNTKMIAEAVYKAMPNGSDIFSVDENPDCSGYDFIAVGGWVDKGMPDEKAKSYMEKIQNKKVGIFMTLGAYPDSDHAKESIEKAEKILDGNNILGSFICQGKVDPELIKWMEQLTQSKPDHPHAMDQERKDRLAEAAKHPNEQDCIDAENTFKEILEQL